MKKKIIVFSVFFGLVFIFLFVFRSIVANQSTLKPLSFLTDEQWSHLENDPAVMYRGKIQYQLRCYKCHGFNGEGVDAHGRYYGVALNDSEWKYGQSYNAILNVIYNGAGEMRSYGKKLVLSDIHAITVYLKTLNQAAEN